MAWEFEPTHKCTAGPTLPETGLIQMESIVHQHSCWQTVNILQKYNCSIFRNEKQLLRSAENLDTGFSIDYI